MRPVPGFPLLAEVVRSGFVESRHTGSAVALGPAGTVALAAGEPGRPMLPRSCAKPLQAVGMLGAGLELAGPLLAVATASHDGTPEHLALVREILAGAGLTEAALRNPAAPPLGQAAAAQLIRSGVAPGPLHQNCSGKHAAMLATCVANGWDLAGYLEPGHPLQQAIRRTTEQLAGEPVAAVTVDGCGAPQLAISLAGLARAFGRLTAAPPSSAERRVADAMRAHPEVVGGAGRDVTRLMRGVPGLLAKDGAEAVYAAATADGAAAAVKVHDGGERARGPFLAHALLALGVEATALGELAEPAVLGGGRRVGVVRLSADYREGVS